jgi:hypothetical protein
MAEGKEHVNCSQVDVDETWRQLCGTFKTISFFSFSREEMRSTVATYGAQRNDHVSLNLKTAAWIKGLELLHSLNVTQLLYLKELASINLTHLEAHTSRKAALYFAFYPALFSFLLNRFPAVFPLSGPDVGLGFLQVYLFLALIGATMFLNFYTAKWQAMEIATCVQLALARQKYCAESPSARLRQDDSI